MATFNLPVNTIEDILSQLGNIQFLTQELNKRAEENARISHTLETALEQKRTEAAHQDPNQVNQAGVGSGSSDQRIVLHGDPSQYNRYFKGLFKDLSILPVSSQMFIQADSSLEFTMVIPLSVIKINKKGMSTKSNPQGKKLVSTSQEVMLQDDDGWYYTGTYRSSSHAVLGQDNFSTLPSIVKEAVFKASLNVNKKGKRHGVPDIKAMYATGSLKAMTINFARVSTNHRVQKVILFVNEMKGL